MHLMKIISSDAEPAPTPPKPTHTSAEVSQHMCNRVTHTHTHYTTPYGCSSLEGRRRRCVLLTLDRCPLWIHMTPTEPPPPDKPPHSHLPTPPPPLPKDSLKIARIDGNQPGVLRKGGKMTKPSVGEQTFLTPRPSQALSAHMATVRTYTNNSMGT